MKFVRYTSRFEAGDRLIEYIMRENKKLYSSIYENSDNCFCFAIPNGGVPIAESFCTHFNLKYDILIVRKIKIPYNPEAGFGSITTDGTVLINEPLLARLSLSEQAINKSIELTKNEINERLKFYNRERGVNELYEKIIKERLIFIVDDGLASGFTMLAAIDMIKKYHPAKIFIAVPTAPLRTIRNIIPKVDGVFCPNIRDVMWFAVADAYKNWYDIPESEVLEIITQSKYFISNLYKDYPL